MPIWRTDGKFDHRKTFTPICQHNFHRKRNKYRPLKSLICLLNPHLISLADTSSDDFEKSVMEKPRKRLMAIQYSLYSIGYTVYAIHLKLATEIFRHQH